MKRYTRIRRGKERERERERVIPFSPKTTQRRREKNTKERERENERVIYAPNSTPR